MAKTFDQILIRLAKRKSYSPQNAHFYITIRESLKRGKSSTSKYDSK